MQHCNDFLTWTGLTEWFTWRHHGWGRDWGVRLHEFRSSPSATCCVLSINAQGDSSSLSLEVEIMIPSTFKREQFHLHRERHKNIHNDTVTMSREKNSSMIKSLKPSTLALAYLGAWCSASSFFQLCDFGQVTSPNCGNNSNIYMDCQYDWLDRHLLY